MYNRDVDTGLLERRTILKDTGDSFASLFAKPGVDEETGFGFFLREGGDDAVLEELDVCFHSFAHGG